jgi:cytosine/adenosine deaminase-related metal-dependent hydrolase
LGDVAILPGLINAHTHLEFSDLTAPLAAATFPEWIRSVLDARRGRVSGPRDAIRRGWKESIAAGTAAVGEIATADETYNELAAIGARGAVYREVLGLRDEAVEIGLATARRFVAGAAPTTLTRGISPHAPYSLHPELFRGLIDIAVDSGAPVAMHVAETREELDLLAHERGGLVDLLASLGLWRPGLFADARRPLDYLRGLGRCRRALVVHGNYLAEDELDFLATQPQMSVAYCPRTHAAFGHAAHPWKRMRERGVRVVFGTDSRASNPDLSLFRELQWVHRSGGEATAGELLRMATRDAAAALGMEEELGAISPGRAACVTVAAPGGPPGVAIWGRLLSPEARAWRLDTGVCAPA